MNRKLDNEHVNTELRGHAMRHIGRNLVEIGVIAGAAVLAGLVLTTDGLFDWITVDHITSGVEGYATKMHAYVSGSTR